MIRDLLFSSASAGGGWTPAELFKNGESGIWLDASDYSTMFQDNGGTIPVTADGQTVGLWNDKSGSGHNVVQATVSSRPLTSTLNGKKYVLSDGVNDLMTMVAAAPGGGTDGITGCCGEYIPSASGTFAAYAYWANNVDFRLLSATSVGSTILAKSVIASNVITLPRSVVTLSYARYPDIPATVVIDGVTSVGAQPGGNPTVGAISIPQTINAQMLYVGQLVIVNRQLTTLEKQQLIDYVTSKA